MKRENYYSWEQTFMEIALTMRKRSKDPKTQVGALIVSEDNRILSSGYNGTPVGFDDDNFPWGKDMNNPLENKYYFVIHAERNTILNYRGNMRDLYNSTCYVTHYPCIECAKEIAQSGIKNIIYYEDKGDQLNTEVTTIIFNKAGIQCRKFKNN